MNRELPDVQAGFRKGRGTRDQISNICWIIEKAREFQKNMYFCFIDYAKAFDRVDHNKLWKILKETVVSWPAHIFLRRQVRWSGIPISWRVVMYGCEIWTIKKAKCWGVDGFELWCRRRLLRVSCKETAKRSNQSILKEISLDYPLEGLMLKLKFQYFGHLMQGTDWLGKTLMLGKI